MSKRNQPFTPSQLERALTAWDADYILNDEGNWFFYLCLAED